MTVDVLSYDPPMVAKVRRSRSLGNVGANVQTQPLIDFPHGSPIAVIWETVQKILPPEREYLYPLLQYQNSIYAEIWDQLRDMPPVVEVLSEQAKLNESIRKQQETIEELERRTAADLIIHRQLTRYHHDLSGHLHYVRECSAMQQQPTAETPMPDRSSGPTRTPKFNSFARSSDLRRKEQEPVGDPNYPNGMLKTPARSTLPLASVKYPLNGMRTPISPTPHANSSPCLILPPRPISQPTTPDTKHRIASNRKTESSGTPSSIESPTDQASYQRIFHAGPKKSFLQRGNLRAATLRHSAEDERHPERHADISHAHALSQPTTPESLDARSRHTPGSDPTGAAYANSTPRTPETALELLYARPSTPGPGASPHPRPIMCNNSTLCAKPKTPILFSPQGDRRPSSPGPDSQVHNRPRPLASDKRVRGRARAGCARPSSPGPESSHEYIRPRRR